MISSAAAKVQMVMDLLDTNEYDDEDNIIGQKEPIITVEEARKLLGIKDEDQ